MKVAKKCLVDKVLISGVALNEASLQKTEIH